MSNLRQLRQTAGLTQVQMAKAVGINVITYQRYESGKRYPDVLTAFRIANVLKVKDLHEVWSGNSIAQV